jgi:hypothetical protein
MRKNLIEEIRVHFNKEFLFTRYDELTGRKINYKYRGITIWIKEILESLLAWVMIAYFFFVGCQIIIFSFSGDQDLLCQYKKELKEIDAKTIKKELKSRSESGKGEGERWVYGDGTPVLKNISYAEILKKLFYVSLIRKVLYFAGAILILDSILLIAALISSPGIDETIDSISISSAGIFILILGYIDFEEFIKEPLLIIKIFVPLTLIITALIVIKHILKRMKLKEVQNSKK